MPNETIPRFEKLAQMHKCIDAPRPDQSVYDECISIAGWIFVDGRNAANCRVRTWLEGAPIGETRLLFARPDVSEFLSLPHDVPTAFRFLARAAGCNEAPRDATIELAASWDGDAAEYLIGKVSVHLVPALLQKRHFGEMLFPAQSRLLHRENVYGSGPPVLEPGVQMLRLILDYLSPGSSVLDVERGAGAYGPALIAAGHQWTEPHRGRNGFPAPTRNSMRQSASRCLSISSIRSRFWKRSRGSFAGGRFSRCRTSRSFPISRIGKLCLAHAGGRPQKFFHPDQSPRTPRSPFLARRGLLLQ